MITIDKPPRDLLACSSCGSDDKVLLIHIGNIINIHLCRTCQGELIFKLRVEHQR